MKLLLYAYIRAYNRAAKSVNAFKVTPYVKSISTSFFAVKKFGTDHSHSGRRDEPFLDEKLVTERIIEVDKNFEKVNAAKVNPHARFKEDLDSLDKISDKVLDIETDIRKINEKISSVEAEIKDTDNQMKKFASGSVEWDYLRSVRQHQMNTEQSLRDEKLLLMRKEQSLRDENQSLNDRILLLMRKEQSLRDASQKDSKIDKKNSLEDFELIPFDMNTVCDPINVPLPVILDSEPPFISRSWIDETVATALEYFRKEDSDKLRVPPLALARCSRGGKTRASKELCAALKHSLPHVSVIFISLHDKTCISEIDEVDPVGAICRRIACAARLNQGSDDNLRSIYTEQFAHADIKENQILKWLGDTPRILVIDELNRLKFIQNSSNSNNPTSSIQSKFYRFLKDNFLVNKNQYFIFTSHIATSGFNIVKHMDGYSISNRDVIYRNLPIVSNISILEDAFREYKRGGTVKVMDLLYFCQIPSFFFLDAPSELPKNTRENAIKECLNDKMINKVTVEELMLSFIDGEKDNVISHLLPFMNTVEEGKIQWIPYHMEFFLRKISAFFIKNSGGDLALYEYGKMYNVIADLMSSIKSAIPDSIGKSGKSWETLFIITLLIRLMARSLSTELLSEINTSISIFECSISYNRYLKHGPQSYKDCTTVPDFLSNHIDIPEHYPHIAVYNPPHAQFEFVDVIVAVYDKNKARTLFGYQMKEGDKLPAWKKVDVSILKLFKKVYWIRGKPQETNVNKMGWHVATTDELKDYFGMSGRHWTPKEWESLDNEGKSSVNKLVSKKGMKRGIRTRLSKIVQD